jgi:1-acyl-sn-glycerol-3-phosphate acyltransferase
MALGESAVTELFRGIEYGYRVVFTGLAFILFALMGLGFRFLACPALNLTVRDPKRRARAARSVTHVSFGLFISLMKALRLMTCEIHGAEKLQRSGLLICPSHPTLLDVVILMSVVKNANCVVKAALLANPYLKSPVRTCGFVSNDSGESLIEDCCASLRNGDNLIIFPEGTRTRPGQEPHFQHGAAAVSLASAVAVTPVRIECVPPTLSKGAPWYRVPERRMHFTIHVMDDMNVAPYREELAARGRPIAVRHLTRDLKHLLFPNHA